MVRSKYGEDWYLTAFLVKEKAGWKCVHCHRPHNPETKYCLTVHHINGITTDNAEENLLALCQRCHLRFQKKSVAIASGQLSLLSNINHGGQSYVVS